MRIMQILHSSQKGWAKTMFRPGVFLSALTIGKREQQILPAFLRASCIDVGQGIWPIPCTCAACWPWLAITATYRVHWHPAEP
jgi:hypothetical protein